jgi:hypothetical protein
MVVAMYAGMALLLPFGHIAAPAASLAAMGASMTVGMVAWMRYRGHGWRPCAEMSASMVLPTVVAIGLFATDVVSDDGVLMTLEHVAMFPLMLAAMLLRPDEYTGHHHTIEDAVHA